MTSDAGRSGAAAAAGPDASARAPRHAPDWVERAVLVHGPRKAGTTLFQNLLDGGEHLFVYPAELKLKWFVRKHGRTGDLDAYVARSRIPGVRSPHLSQQRYRALWDAALAARDLRDLGEFVRHDAWAVFRSSSKRPAATGMWCAKEVGGETERIVGAWRGMFPQGRVLLILRDPLMVTRAVLNDRRRQGKRLTARKIVHETLDPMRVVKAQSLLMDGEDTLAIAYEDLVADTEGVMRRVAEFLSMPYTPRFTVPTVLGEPVVVSTSSRQTTEVFRPAAAWSDGLTRRERTIVAAARAAGLLLPRYSANYARLRRRIAGPGG